MVDFKDVDLNLLVSLDSLLAERNVTRAAHKLSMSQSALSAQLLRLRQVFGDQLLIPAGKGRGMTPTARALELADALHAALKDLEVVVKRKPRFDPMKDGRAFQIAAMDYPIVVLGLPLMKQLESAAPCGIKLAFRAAVTSAITDQMGARRNRSINRFRANDPASPANRDTAI